jgi:APA family basic amino acid/polyamine antiporter
MPGYPLLPLLFILVSLAVVVASVVADPLDSALGLLLVAAGIPAYFIWRPRAAKRLSS